MSLAISDLAIEPLLTVAQAAKVLGLSISTLNKWRLTGGGPTFVKYPTAVRYRLSDLQAFIAANLCNSTSEADFRRAA